MSTSAPAIEDARLERLYAYWLSKNGIDPEKDVKAFYAGSHAASYEALVNHKAQAGRPVSQHVVKLIQHCRVGQQMRLDQVFQQRAHRIMAEWVDLRRA